MRLVLRKKFSCLFTQWRRTTSVMVNKS